MHSIRSFAQCAARGALLGAFLLPGLMRAQARQPLQELFLAQLPYTQDKGEFQFTMTHARVMRGQERRSQTSAAVEFGISSRWQIELEALGREQFRGVGQGRTSIESASLSAQRGLISTNGQFRALLGAEVEIPFGTSAEGEENVMMGPSIAVMRDLLPLHGLRILASGSLSAPVSGPTDAAHSGSEYNVQIAAFLPVARARFTIELNRSSGGEDENLPMSLIAPGVVLSLPHGIELGMAVPVSIIRNPRFVSTVFRLVYEF